jgi:hypothetical protein
MPGLNGLGNEQCQKSNGCSEDASVDANHNASPVQSVGEKAGNGRQDWSGSVEEDCDQPHLEGGTGQLVDEIAQHQELHPPGNFVDGSGGPENAEVPDLQNGQGRDSGSP